MTCNKFELFTSAYLDREMSEQEGMAYRAHQSECAACRRYLSEVEDASFALRRCGRPEVPQELRSYVMTAIERRVTGGISIKQQAFEWLLKFNPRPLSYAAGMVVSTILFAVLLAGLKPIPVIESAGERAAIVPLIWGSTAEYRIYNHVPPDADDEKSDHHYQLPRVLNNSALVSFSHIAYQKPGDEGMAALVEVESDGRARLVDMLDEPSDPYIIEQLWWSLSERTFQPAIVEGKAAPTRIVLFVEKMDVSG